MVTWLKDEQAAAEGIYPAPFSSFLRCLWTSLAYTGHRLDLARVAGVSVFAFRIRVADSLCMGAMSMFDWALLPEGVRRLGYDSTYIWPGERRRVAG